ncbi:MAG TPA: hypothetical protein VIM51_09810 [Desulfosporosinus sp.]
MMNRDGFRPIQRVKELAIMGGNEGNPLVPFGMGFFYLGVLDVVMVETGWHRGNSRPK